MVIELEQFFVTGQFGPVKIDMQKNQVISLLGQPSSQTSLGDNGSLVLYGWYELFFDHTDSLSYIQNDSYTPADSNSYAYKNDLFSIDSWFLDQTPDQSITQITEQLSNRQYQFHLIDYYGREAIAMASGVVIDFSEQSNSQGVKELIGFRYAPEW